jgi:hypothetical protein
MHLPVEQVMHLHQIHVFRPQPRQRSFHLPDAVSAAAGPHLGGEEKAVAHAELRRQITDYRLSVPVHRGAIHHLPAKRDEARQHLLQRRIG